MEDGRRGGCPDPLSAYRRAAPADHRDPERPAGPSGSAPAGFPEAQLLVSIRTGPLTASLTSIYEDKAAFDRSVEERTRRMAENGHFVCQTSTSRSLELFLEYDNTIHMAK